MERRLAVFAICAIAVSILVAAPTTMVRVGEPVAARTFPHRVVLLGDSMTYASGLADDEDFASVISRDRPDLDVINAAVPGNLTSDALARVRDVTDSHPGTVVVWLGTNEVFTGLPVATFASQLSMLLDRMAPALEVVITPADNRYKPGDYRPYAEAVREVAVQRDCGLVDLDSVISIGDLRDGLHLDAAAVVRVAHLIERQIR